MDTIFMTTVLDPVIALIGILVPLGVAYVILAWPVHFRHGKLEQPSDHDSGTRN